MASQKDSNAYTVRDLEWGSERERYRKTEGNILDWRAVGKAESTKLKIH